MGVDVEPYSVGRAQRLIAERGLDDRCESRIVDADRLGDDGAYDLATSFLVVHGILPEQKTRAFAAVSRALAPGGAFVIFDETCPETDEALRSMPSRFAALAQWYELTWGNCINTRTERDQLCHGARLEITEETSFSWFYVGVATRR